ncbi:MAG: ribosome assembly RNA-binding protein YhbY, partial [Oscillospiraceae bacterium]|nr:ribosome assembly RNA-binding protein YhbY [Candidatus Equicaccousia limihippi]
MTLTSKQRAFLRAKGNSLETVFQIGKQGLNDALLKQTDELLELRELVKLRVLETCEISSREAADTIANGIGAQVVQVIGSRFILFKESNEHKNISLEVKRIKT